jgi:hypothetical protein
MRNRTFLHIVAGGGLLPDILRVPGVLCVERSGLA